MQFAGEELRAEKVVLAPGHSARSLYRHLARLGVKLDAKPFAMGFRIEHPQDVIDKVQLGEEAARKVERGAGKVPVADYRLTASVPNSVVERVRFQPRPRHIWIIQHVPMR
jgi:uncharacterized protein